MDRNQYKREFLERYFGSNCYTVSPMLGDASMRSYYRIYSDKVTFVLMDCPPCDHSTKTFIAIDHFLQMHGYSVPTIIAQDLEQGFLLLEDFGDTSLKKYMTGVMNGQESRYKTYCLIIDLLVHLHNIPVPEFLPTLGDKELIDELDVFVDWYIPYKLNRKIRLSEQIALKEIWALLLKQQQPMKSVVVLKDYHLENMMYLDERDAIQKIGLLDFQDAVSGSPVYDLVSLLEDARIEVPRGLALKLITYFAVQSNMDVNTILMNYHILGAQRNMRILGVFARKAQQENDHRYIEYMPRVQRYMRYDLSHPVMRNLSKWYQEMQG